MMPDAAALRRGLLDALPIRRGAMTIRRWERPDLDVLSRWPPYPEPYGVFSFTFAHLGPAEMDSFYDSRSQQQDRITLVLDQDSDACVGYLSLLGIDWGSGRCENMGIRVHPEECGRGIGSRMLAAVRDWWFDSGMTCLRLDVAGSNVRAVKCYEKVGFTKTGERWREAPDLRGKDLSEPRWRFLTGHIRLVSPTPEVQFLLMELQSDE
jgi:RimJ/RimL family protein N-acetyltransferase